MISVLPSPFLNHDIYTDIERKTLTKHHSLLGRKEENSNNILMSLLKLLEIHKEAKFFLSSYHYSLLEIYLQRHFLDTFSSISYHLFKMLTISLRNIGVTV